MSDKVNVHFHFIGWGVVIIYLYGVILLKLQFSTTMLESDVDIVNSKFFQVFLLFDSERKVKNSIKFIKNAIFEASKPAKKIHQGVKTEKN